MVIGGYRVGALLRKTVREIGDDHILGLAAQTAYYFFFSLFPLFLFLAPLLTLIVGPEDLSRWATAQLAATLPPDAVRVFSGWIDDVVFAPSAPGIASVGALAVAWAGSSVFTALMDALNQAYDVVETRRWIKRRLIALAAVAGAGVFFVAATAIMLGGPEIVSWVRERTSLGSTFATVWSILQYPLAFVLLVAILWMTYYFLPNLRQSRKQVLVGALAAGVLWVIATLLFRAYVANFGSYNKTYGAVGGVIVLLLWMYYTMVVVLAGGELNSELHHGSGAVDVRRGAVYEGRLVTSTEPGRPSNERVERAVPVRSGA